MGVRIRALTGLFVTMSVPLAAVVLLRAPDAGPGPEWGAAMPLETAVVESARLAALGLAYLVLATTAAHLVAVAARWGRGSLMTGRLVLPIVRRLVDRAVAGSLAMSLLAGPALAAPLPEVDEVGVAKGTDLVAPRVAEGYAPGPYRLGRDQAAAPGSGEAPRSEDAPVPDPVGAAAPPDPGDTAATPVEGPPAPDGAGDSARGASTVVVQPGDSLWSLSAHRLAQVLGRPPRDPELAPYWVATVESNTGRLRSGDPDLIHPGEQVVLPDPGSFIPAGS